MPASCLVGEGQSRLPIRRSAPCSLSGVDLTADPTVDRSHNDTVDRSSADASNNRPAQKANNNG